jgi:hypothetical protein
MYSLAFLIKIDFILTKILNNSSKQSGAVEACWAHNPEVRGSKPRSASFFYIPTFLVYHF